jgi:hypothetical protein
MYPPQSIHTGYRGDPLFPYVAVFDRAPPQVQDICYTHTDVPLWNKLGRSCCIGV